MEVNPIEKRIWIKSGIVEELDKRQSQLLKLVYAKIQYYYKHLYQTRACYQYPLSLSRLMKLCNRSGTAVSAGLRYLANTVPADSKTRPLIHYDRIASERNPSHRPYRIWLDVRRTHDLYEFQNLEKSGSSTR